MPKLVDITLSRNNVGTLLNVLDLRNDKKLSHPTLAMQTESSRNSRLSHLELAVQTESSRNRRLSHLEIPD